MAVIGFFAVCAVAYGLPRAVRYGAIAFLIGLTINYVVIAVTSREFDLAADGRNIGVLLLLAAAMVAGGIARVVGGGAAGIVVSVLLVIIAKRTLRNDPRDSFARRLVHGIVSRRGTRFTDADLSNADVTHAQLAHSDLSGATLEGAQLDTTVGRPPFLPTAKGHKAPPDG